MKIPQSLRRAASAAFASVLALVLPSCFEADSTVHLKKDGSGTITNKMVMGAQMTQMMQMAAAEGGEGKVKNPLTDEAQFKEQAKEMGEGVEFVKVEELKLDDGRSGAVATYKFSDIRKLKMDTNQGPPGGAGPDMGEGGEGEAPAKKANETPITFDFTPGDTAKLTVFMPKPSSAKEGAKKMEAEKTAGDDKVAGEGEEAAPAGGDEAAMQMMGPMFAGMRVSMNIEVEGNVTESTATNRDGQKITMMDIDVGKMMANPEILKKMSSPDDMQNFEKMSALAKEAGSTIEPKQEFTVEFK